MSAVPILTELRFEGTDDAYVEEWYCEPPDIGVQYKVVEDRWSDDWNVRSIYRIELADY